MVDKKITGVPVSITISGEDIVGPPTDGGEYSFGKTMTVTIESEQEHMTDLYIFIQGEYVKVGKIQTDLLARSFYEVDYGE